MKKKDDPIVDRQQALAYIGEASADLAKLARANKLRFLAYLLEMIAVTSAKGDGGKT